MGSEMCIRDRYSVGRVTRDEDVAHAGARERRSTEVDGLCIEREPAEGSGDVGVAVGVQGCLLYTSDAADERSSVDLGGRRILKKKQKQIKKKNSAGWKTSEKRQVRIRWVRHSSVSVQRSGKK